jgi:glutathione gamma-glutamylcysteinyltransferase
MSTPSVPEFSFHRRVLPSSLTQLSSPKGKILFRESLLSDHAEAYFILAEQFVTQSEPAYCAVATLIMVLNAFGLDPNVRWKDIWRWYGSEDMILKQCHINTDEVRHVGLVMEEFASLGRCQGLSITLKRPLPLDDASSISLDKSQHYYDLNEFRRDLITMVQNPPVYEVHDANSQEEVSYGGFLVIAFSRKGIGQTGDGHYSPIAAYHEPTDQCLVLDVARFKYAPFWVSVQELYESTKPHDSVSNKSRGWFLIYPTKRNELTYSGSKTLDDRRKPINLVPTMDEVQGCPMSQMTTETCSDDHGCCQKE